MRTLTGILLLTLIAATTAFATPVVKMKTITEKTKTYEVDYEVPQFQNPTPVQRAFNERAMKYAKVDLDAFRKQVKEESAGGPLPWGFTIKIHPRYLSDRWFSWEIRGGQYTGGAHPNPITLSSLYDLKQGKELELKDLFRPGTPYLQTIADICRKDLKKRELGSDEAWQNKGSAPTKTNYQSFYIDGKTLTIVFGPYQVASYAEGPVLVSIPYADLKSIAADDGPLLKK